MVIQRLTGDPHPEELVTPLWALEKQKNLQAIHHYMHAMGLYQGKHFRAAQGKG
jgi:radical SAM superfamily enzyme